MVSDWRPTTSLQNLKIRAKTLEKIRRFFAARNVMEVETPVLCQGIGTDPNLAYFSTQYQAGSDLQTFFMQTSPEFCMKRLLAGGSGCIYQISKVFRNDESGRFHNPEFTMLEWYRLDFNLQQLMDEVSDLIKDLFSGALTTVEQVSYSEIFHRYTNLDPLEFEVDRWRQCAKNHNLADAETICGKDHLIWLDFLFSFLVQPQLGKQSICLVYDYPACQSSLARVKDQEPRLVERVEVFIDGVELGNGYFELTDPIEQQLRFENEQLIRKQQGLETQILDWRFLEAINSGLPTCSGMAIGLDRLLMVITGSRKIEEVIAFPFKRA